MEKESTPERPSGQTYDLSGMFSLALRLVSDGLIFLHSGED